MDLESECSVLESVEDNEEISNDSVPQKLGNISESKVQNNGFSVVENNDNNDLFPEVKQKGADVSEYTNSPHVDLKPEVSPSPTMARRGYGLKKWRRIRRDSNKGGDSTIDTGKMVMHELSNSSVNSSKRMQYAEKEAKSEVSFSSTNAVVRSFDGFPVLDDSGLGLGPSFAAGTDSENSEDRSSKSSTAASAPKIKYETPVIVGFPRDNSRIRSLSGKNLTHSVQRGLQGKGGVETTKKARGVRVKIEKENSHSSLESDSRSSNFVFMQGTYSTNNGIGNQRPKHYDGENGDEVPGRDGEGGYENLPREDVVADSSWEVKDDRSENHGSSRDEDPLVESMFALQSVQEALEKEVQKIKEVSEDISVDDSVSDLGTEFIDDKQKLQKMSAELLPYSEVVQSFSQAVQSEVTGNRDAERELEDLYKQKIEAEVEYMAIARTVQKLRVDVDQITVLEEQKALASEQTQILDKLGVAENKAAVLKKEAEKLENICEDIASADEIIKLQNRVCKYSSCFFVQLVLLVVILGVFIFHLSPTYVEVVPT
ncbi:hypothetical protein DH2020_017001 [Rehmannia glutinosa]|uniref:WPP domain-interacting protein n=1 Tax=Rehmannia glutinosa TaxID=99300 RepID=A0ABR0WS86_REHGL